MEARGQVDKRHMNAVVLIQEAPILFETVYFSDHIEAINYAHGRIKFLTGVVGTLSEIYAPVPDYVEPLDPIMWHLTSDALPQAWIIGLIPVG